MLEQQSAICCGEPTVRTSVSDRWPVGIRTTGGDQKSFPERLSRLAAIF
jgi:hypothetical protein